jgi:hypothetical protein
MIQSQVGVMTSAEVPMSDHRPSSEGRLVPWPRVEMRRTAEELDGGLPNFQGSSFPYVQQWVVRWVVTATPVLHDASLLGLVAYIMLGYLGGI